MLLLRDPFWSARVRSIDAGRRIAFKVGDRWSDKVRRIYRRFLHRLLPSRFELSEVDILSTESSEALKVLLA